MSPVYRLQTIIQSDTAFPRDAVVMNPVVNDTGVTTDPQGLADDWATFMQGWIQPALHHQVTVKVYDCQGTKPVYPAATKVLDVGQADAATVPRELAVCLSFRGDHPEPRKRGRLYVPYFLTGLGSAQLGPRPSATVRTKVAAIATGLAELGGVDVDWNIWSKMDNAAHAVEHWWVDDEWDVVRSRGLDPTTRTSGDTSG